MYQAIQYAVDKLPHILSYMSRGTAFDELSLVNLLPIPILITICGIVLWYQAPLFAYSIFGTSASVDTTAASLADIQVTAFSIIGLLVIANAISDVTSVGTVEYLIASYSAADEMRKIRNVYIAFSLVKIAFGMWLLFGSRGIFNFIRSMRRD